MIVTLREKKRVYTRIRDREARLSPRISGSDSYGETVRLKPYPDFQTIQFHLMFIPDFNKYSFQLSFHKSFLV